ncbi:hypothetical protein [Pedobacter nototheniae]|uniref:hypothetical protein n=1 Tax=Pedobacter nototheniae TaxID=2488994 RepID=UPI002930F9AB|nr:hypothetical protein [Pedobacter nototheniae]
MNKIKLFVLLVFTFFYGKSFAVPGCAINYAVSGMERIYYAPLTRVSGSSLDNYGGSPTYNNSGFPTTCPRYNYQTAVSDGTRCCINGVCDASYRYVANFTPINCPLDDYIPVLVLVMGGIGYSLLRRNSLSIF